MTFDFIDQLEEACDNEGVAFLIIIQSHDGERASMRVNLDNWINADEGWSAEEDIVDAIKACLVQKLESEEGDYE